MALTDYPSEDPRGLIHEAYHMDIGLAECRSIFVDWALGTHQDEPEVLIPALLKIYAVAQPDHPMTTVLQEGLTTSSAPRRRGGRAGRVPSV